MNKKFFIGKEGVCCYYGDEINIDTEKTEKKLTIYNKYGETISLEVDEMKDLFTNLQDILLDDELL